MLKSRIGGGTGLAAAEPQIQHECYLNHQNISGSKVMREKWKSGTDLARSPLSHLKSLGYPISEANGEFLHLGDFQPLLLGLVLCAGFHHHLHNKGYILDSVVTKILVLKCY